MENHTFNDSTVVSFAKYRGDMSWLALKQMEAYWDGLRNGKAVPGRADVNPRGIENILEYAFVLERIAPGVARFRLAGMHLVDLIGMEVKGMPLTAFFTPASRQPVSKLLEDVFQEPEIAELVLTAQSGFGRPELNARMLLLPLKSDLGDVTRALGCLVSDGTIGRAPRRFDLEEARRKTVGQDYPSARQAPQGARPQVETTDESNALNKGFAEQQSGFMVKNTLKKSKHLRLVTSNE